MDCNGVTGIVIISAGLLALSILLNVLFVRSNFKLTERNGELNRHIKRYEDD